MKKILYFLLGFSFILSSCTEDNNEPNDNNKPSNGSQTETSISLSDIEGVWTSEDFFVSFNSDKFCTSFVAKGFLDSGKFTFSSTKTNATISCRNTYFNHTTTYYVESLSSSKMTLKVDYTDYNGVEKSTRLYLNKTSEHPVEIDNPLVGKIASARSQYWTYVITTFSTYCSGTRAAQSGNAAKYPLNMFYIYRNDTMYAMYFTNKNHQTPSIGAWTTMADNGNIYQYQVEFASDGTISYLTETEQIKE